MLTPKYTTVDRILEKVRSEGFEEVPRDDVMEWIWDVVGYLGIVQAFEDKWVEVDFENYSFIPPVDLYKIEGIREKISQASLRRSTDLFQTFNHMDNETGIIRTEGETITVGVESTVFATTAYGYIRAFQLTYLDKNDRIYIGFKEGTLQMNYKAFPVDEAGYPKIPDDAKYIRAVVDYICMKLAKRLWLKDLIIKSKYDELSTQYYYSAGAARTNAQIPDMDMMEAIKNRFLRLIPTITEHRSGFRFLGEAERLNKM